MTFKRNVATLLPDFRTTAGECESCRGVFRQFDGFRLVEPSVSWL